MPRKHLTEDLAEDIDGIRSLPPQLRRYIMRDARIVIDETLSRMAEDAEDLLWFINCPKDYSHIYREDLGTRFEAIMPRGPPQNARQFTKAQAEKTLERVRGWREDLAHIDQVLAEIEKNLKMMGLFYLVRNP